MAWTYAQSLERARLASEQKIIQGGPGRVCGGQVQSEIGLGKAGGDGWGLMVDGYDCQV